MEPIKIRPGRISDTTTLRRVFEYASHGLSPYLWKKAVNPGDDFDAFVDARMQSKVTDPNQTFMVAEVDGYPTGGILTYLNIEIHSVASLSPLERSFTEMDNALTGTLYVNAIAVFPEFRRLGIASLLLDRARREAADRGLPLSLSVCDANPDAISTYLSNGFEFVGKVPMEKEDWDGAGDNWLLMVNRRDFPWEQEHIGSLVVPETTRVSLAGV